MHGTMPAQASPLLKTLELVVAPAFVGFLFLLSEDSACNLTDVGARWQQAIIRRVQRKPQRCLKLRTGLWQPATVLPVNASRT